MRAVQTAKEIMYLEHMIPGIQTGKEKCSYWTNDENAGDRDVLIKDVFLLFISAFCFQNVTKFRNEHQKLLTE